MEKPTYWQKQEKPLFSDLLWNLPEQKSGKVSIVGGSSQNFSTEIKTAEFFTSHSNLEELKIILPDSLKQSLPPLPNFTFTPSTDSGTFKKSAELSSALETTDFSVFLGDFSKNSETTVAICDLLKSLSSPILLTRDTVDLVCADAASLIEKENLFILASAVQLQKLFRALYYPKMLLLSMPILPFVETLHKFTLSYKTTLITFHEGQILVAKDGKVISTPIEKTSYSPISLWNGELAARIATLNLANPSNPLESTAAALLWQ